MTGHARRAFGVMLLAALAAGLTAREAAAQTQQERAPALVSWGKWGAAALFVGLTAYGVTVHNDANADYRSLVRYCQDEGGSCLLAPDGTYQDPRSEQLYQSSIDGDRSARVWLVAGQLALVGAVALFITELRYSHGPRNIPYEPQLEVLPGPAGTRVGLRLQVPLRGP